MGAICRGWLSIILRYLVISGVAFSLSTAIVACDSGTAPRFPPEQEEIEDEDPGDDEDDG